MSNEVEVTNEVTQEVEIKCACGEKTYEYEIELVDRFDDIANVLHATEECVTVDVERRAQLFIEFVEENSYDITHPEAAISYYYEDRYSFFDVSFDEVLTKVEEEFIGEFDSREEFARELTSMYGDDKAIDELPEYLRYCIDWTAVARDLLAGDYYEVEGREYTLLFFRRY